MSEVSFRIPPESGHIGPGVRVDTTYAPVAITEAAQKALAIVRKHAEEMRTRDAWSDRIRDEGNLERQRLGEAYFANPDAAEERVGEKVAEAQYERDQAQTRIDGYGKAARIAYAALQDEVDAGSEAWAARAMAVLENDVRLRWVTALDMLKQAQEAHTASAGVLHMLAARAQGARELGSRQLPGGPHVPLSSTVHSATEALALVERELEGLREIYPPAPGKAPRAKSVRRRAAMVAALEARSAPAEPEIMHIEIGLDDD
jgi:hypothetical protein